MKKYSFIIVSVILCFCFLKLLSNYSDTFKSVEDSYIENSAINLVKGISSEKIYNVLITQNYVENESDAKFIAEQLAHKVNDENASSKKQLKTLYDLQKRIWQVPSDLIDSIGSPLFQERLLQSQNSLGIDNLFRQLNPDTLSASRSFGKGKGVINVTVKSEDTSASYLKKLLHQNDTLCSGIIVRLSEHYLDSLDANKPNRRTICYLKTDTNGQVSFKGLDTEISYSVIPICKGYEYGTPKGTIGGNLFECAEDGILNCTFSQVEHKIRLFDALTLKQIKEDKTITVRSPKEFKSLLAKYLALFFGAWWGLYLWVSRRKYQINREVLSILMLLTGFCLLTMFSINDPLVDKLLGIDMAQGIIAGIIVILLILNVDFVKLYQDKLRIGFDIPMECIKWIFKPFRLKVKYLTETLSNKRSNVLLKIGALLIIVPCLFFLLLDLFRLTKISDKVNAQLDKFPKGSGYLLVALFLTVLLFTPLGVAVGGMKVNLNLGILFQPSEIVKYLIIVFMAAYFSVNANNIVKYSEKGNTNLFGSKLRMLLSIIIGLGILMGLYLVLGDMGPALVLAFTFIILYSIIKSKIDLEGLSEQKQLIRILTCDLAMLIYGVILFIIFLCVGNVIGSMGIGCIAWFFIWIIIGITKKQIFESPIYFNLILAAFIFGGSILSDSKISKLQSVGERLESRNEMCTNTWGTLPIDGMVADAGENTQVAEGLWGLASGGLWGQGLGNGSPHFIPAFHTDMILESIGEQLGFVGILIIIILLALLLRKTIILGYKTSHPFAFYLCLGIAIVTAVQFVIISLGSTGIVPLTGVTVPFFSYGKVSMILSLAAFGIILSISKHNVTDNQEAVPEITKLRKQNISKYNYSVSILSWVYSCFSLLIISVFFYYQFIDRNDTLIRPVYVNNSSGIPVVEYNPRIESITQKMYVGDIYDRKGVLLATSDKSSLSKYKNDYAKCNVSCDTLKLQKRYYPFGEHLYFMLGDFNTKLFFSSIDRSPRGYMAEARHLSELRGYDNVLRDNEGKPIKVDLYSDEYTPGRYYASDYSTSQRGLQLRDYSALIPYLKAGINSEKITRLNNRETHFWESGDIEPQDIQMTIDAILQTKLQQRIPEYIAKQFNNGNWDRAKKEDWNKLRISIVVLDAEHGDMLASANYPLPNYDFLRMAPDSYSDNYKDRIWRAYTERDLGMTRPTAPGSTAKIMSALAGLRKIGLDAANPQDRRYSYFVDSKEKVGLEPTGIITMQKAIVESSNCYFINLVNAYDLYDELAYIYSSVGVELKGEMPYCLNYNEYSPESDWCNLVLEDREGAINAYSRYIEKGVKEPMRKHPAWFWVWGQGQLWATPLTIARASSIVANKGNMPTTRYLMTQKSENIQIVSSEEADRLKAFMRDEAKEKGFTSPNIGGKTGTAERDIWDVYGRKLDNAPNDGWFVCFIDNANIGMKDIHKDEYESYPSSLVVAVRMERLGDGMSGQAVALTKDIVENVLKKELHYIQ